MITAICEMADQATGIEDARLIESHAESVKEYEDEMDEMMGMYGYRLYFYDIECTGIEDWTESEIYEFMRVNAHLEIDA